MPSPNAYDFRSTLDASAAAIASLAKLEPEFRRAAALIEASLTSESGGKLLICGNGGSAADAAHLATEFVVRYRDDRRPYAAIALADSGSTLTAAGNDYGFDHVFARQVRALGRRGDVLIAFTTSGNSRNVVLALDAAREAGIGSIALLGRDGGAARGLATVDLIVPHDVTARIQEAHKVLLHALCEAVEPALKRG